MPINTLERRRREVVTAAANLYQALIDPELLDALMALMRDPLVAVCKAVQNMREGEVVLTLGHFVERP